MPSRRSLRYELNIYMGQYREIINNSCLRLSENDRFLLALIKNMEIMIWRFSVFVLPKIESVKQVNFI